MNSPVPSLAVTFTDDEIRTVQADVGSILRSGRLNLGPYTERLETEIAAIAGTRHAVTTSTGTTALEIIFRILDVDKRPVLIPTNTNYATAAAAANAGADVVLYDNDVYPDLDDLRRKLPGAAAVAIVHIGGYLSPDLRAILDMCSHAGIPVIEDSAHAHGAQLRGRPAGSWGTASAFSFYPTKVVTSGEGGAITTNDPEIAALARQYRDQGKTPDGLRHTVWGNSWRITEMAAAVALAQLATFQRDAEYRRNVIDTYQQLLHDVPGLTFVPPHAGHRPSGYKALALLDHGIDRDQVKIQTMAHGAQLGREVYQIPLHQQPIFAAIAEGQFPHADDFAARHISLPIWRFITDEQVRTTARALRLALAPSRFTATTPPRPAD